MTSKSIAAACCVALACGIGVAAGDVLPGSGGGAGPPTTATTTAGPPYQLGPAPPTLPRLTPPAAVPLATGWSYLADPGDAGLSAHWLTGDGGGRRWTPISIPNDFNGAVSRRSYSGSVGWYKVTFTGPAITAGRTWDIHFDEVRRIADVWLNGVHLGRNSFGYAPFSMAATSLRPGRANTLVVRVDNRLGTGSFPEDWWNWGGIVQPVALVPQGRIELTGLGVMPQLGCANACGSLLVEGTVTNVSNGPLAPTIYVRTRSPQGISASFRHLVGPVAPHQSVQVQFTVPLHGPPDLWSPSSPSLYAVKVVAMVQDRVEQQQPLKVGMRSVEVRHGLLYLNGSRLWLHGASIHEDVEGRGAALTDADIATIVRQLKQVGANATRAHYLLSQRLLDQLDAAGILVWSQPPVDHAEAQLRTASGRAQALSMLRATIIGARSHPSMIIDSVANEISPTPDRSPGTLAYLQDGIALARRLDPAAVVALDTYCYPGFPAQKVYAQADVIGISSYFGWYKGLPGHPITRFGQLQPFLALSHQRYPDQALVVSEFGAEGVYPGAASIKGTYQFQSDYIDKTFVVLDGLPFMNGAIYWTLREFAVNPGWTGGATLPAGDPPTGIHHKGLIAYNGSDKPAFVVAAQVFAHVPPFIAVNAVPLSPSPPPTPATG